MENASGYTTTYFNPKLANEDVRCPRKCNKHDAYPKFSRPFFSSNERDLNESSGLG